MPEMPLHLRRTFPVLIVSAVEDDQGSAAQRGRAVAGEIESFDFPVSVVHGYAEGASMIAATPNFSCVVLGLESDTDLGERLGGLEALISAVRRHNAALPLFIATSREAIGKVPVEILRETEGYIWLFEDSPSFIAGRIAAAAARYLDTVLPPFFGALVNFSGVHEYSWHTPGHAGGVAFQKTAVGRAFLAFYGEEMLRSDLSISVGELGSLNDHSGPVKAAEELAAETFGADFTAFVVAGSSASNQMVLDTVARDGDLVLVDRNCHKSLNYALNMSGATPIYLMPRRNVRGVIGPVAAEEMTPEAIAGKIAANPLVTSGNEAPVLAVLTNSTYDGLCYDIKTTTSLLGRSTDQIHYDEAWYGYARFNPLYAGRFGMHAGKREDDEPTVTATQSTHKLLAGLSQSSLLHVRQGRKSVDFSLLNEAFMMHTSTSPQYAIIASNDVASKMMRDSGPALTDETLREAVDFRQEVARIGRQLKARDPNDWWFDTWGPQTAGGVAFADADPAELISTPDVWMLAPNEDWHGFGDLGDDYCMLDPIKVTILTPGVGPGGALDDFGIPAPIVTAFLDAHGVIAEKTEPYSILMLFSMGITKGKWGSLVSALLEFKDAFDADRPLASCIPTLVETHGERYRGVGLKILAAEMHATHREVGLLEHLDRAFMELPEPAMIPREAYNKMVHGHVERVHVSQLMNRTLAVQVVPYPPGIPVLMPGERITAASAAIPEYLVALEAFDTKFPGFEHDTHGIEVERGPDGAPRYMTFVLTDA